MGKSNEDALRTAQAVIALEAEIDRLKRTLWAEGAKAMKSGAVAFLRTAATAQVTSSPRRAALEAAAEALAVLPVPPAPTRATGGTFPGDHDAIWARAAAAMAAGDVVEMLAMHEALKGWDL